MLLILVFSSCQQGPKDQLKSPWKPYSQQAVEDSIAHKRAVVIDFFAEWCPMCHELDRTVFSRPEIRAKLAQVTALRMDVTDEDAPQVQKIIREYNVEGVPTIIFLDSRGVEVNNSRVAGLVTPDEFSQILALLS